MRSSIVVDAPIERAFSVYDIGVDGSECRWSRELAYEPPDRYDVGA